MRETRTHSFHRLLAILIVLCTIDFTTAEKSSKISLKEMYSMPLKFAQIGKYSYEQISMVFGAAKSSTSTGTTILMLPDLSYNAITIGSAPDLNWGIDCTDNNGCSTMQGTVHTCSRLGATSSCLNVSTFLRFRNQTLPSTTNRLTIEMMTSQDSWQPKGEGILGLGPQSPLWQYLKNEFETENPFIDVSLFYRANFLDKLISLEGGNFKNAVFVVNGKGIAVDPFFVGVSDAGNGKSWILDSINFTKTVDDKIIESQEKACLANSINFTIASNKFAELKRSVFNQLCGNPVSCSKAGSDITKIKPWTFKVFNTSDPDSFMEISLNNNEIVNFGSDGNAVLMVDDLSNYPTICQDATIALGKFFLSAREVVVRYNKESGKFLVGFHSFEPSILFLIILLGLASVIFLIFLVLCILSIVSKLKKYMKEQEEIKAAANEKDEYSKDMKGRLMDS